MYLSIWIIAILALIIYAIGYHVGQNDAREKAQRVIDELQTRIVGYRRLLTATKKLVKAGEDISGLSEKDADYFAELTQEEAAKEIVSY